MIVAGRKVRPKVSYEEFAVRGLKGERVYRYYKRSEFKLIIFSGFECHVLRYICRKYVMDIRQGLCVRRF